jgi:HAMP domain-containing protein
LIQAPIRIRTFILGTVLVLLLVPTLAAGAAWLIEGNRQQADIQNRVNAAADYLTSHSTEMQEPAAVQGFVRLIGRLDLLAQVTLITKSPPGKHPIYTSPILEQVKAPPGKRLLGPGKTTTAPVLESWSHDRERLLPAGTRKTPATLITDLYHRPASRTTQALVALVAGVLVLLAGLTATFWLAGRWMVTPLTRLSAQVDKVAGGDLTIEVPRSRIGEIANIAQAVDGMTEALGETAQRRAEADEARRFLVTSIAHDLRHRSSRYAAICRRSALAWETRPFTWRGPRHEQTHSNDWSATCSPTHVTTTRSRQFTSNRRVSPICSRRLQADSTTRPASETTRSTFAGTSHSKSSSTATA